MGMTMAKKRTHRSRMRRAMQTEQLEARVVLSANGALWGTDARMTLSFAPDGTNVDGHASQLHAELDNITSRENWQSAILQGFQTWAKHTNSDIGLVADGGQPFGVAGRMQGDARFGDVRVGAIPLDPGILAVSVPFSEVVDGTWSGELLFNSTEQINSIDEILAIAAHEAGNIFGLEDSTDPLSPLYDAGIPTVIEPTSTDIANLHARYGARVGDIFDVESFDTGDLGYIELDTFESLDGDDGSAPTVAFGDISGPAEQDVFEHELEEDYAGSFTIAVQTEGISQLPPSLLVEDQNGNLLAFVNGTAGKNASVTFNPGSSVSDFVIRVGSSDTLPNSVGGYSLVMTYDGWNQISDHGVLSDLVMYPQRLVEIDDLEEYFEDGNQLLLNDDYGNDNLPGSEQALETTPGFVEGTRYQIAASIETVGDVDRYVVESPGTVAIGTNTALVSLQSVDVGEFNGALRVYDSTNKLVDSETLIHNGDQVVIQFPVTSTSEDFFIEVSAADSTVTMNTGSYELVARFGQPNVERETFASGLLRGHRAKTVRLDVDRSQLFHFVLEANKDVSMTILDSSNNAIFSLSTSNGEPRSGAVLIPAGNYRVRFIATEATSPMNMVNFQLRGGAVDDPLGPQFDDPTDHAYEFYEKHPQLVFLNIFPF